MFQYILLILKIYSSRYIIYYRFSVLIIYIEINVKVVFHLALIDTKKNFLFINICI